MDASPARTFVIAAWAVLLGAVMGHAACDPSTDPDKADIANARAAVAANCLCGTATIHGAYVSCAAQQANSVLANKSCAGFVKKCASRSTCGKPGFVTCCRTNSKGVTRCSVKSGPAKCVAPRGGSRCVGQFASCCDACTASGCAAPTTSSTTTTTTTTLTATTTLPRIPCAGGTEPQCTDGACAGGEQCAENAEVPPSTECDCFPPGVTPCGSSGFPQCNGACLEGKVCGKFQQFQNDQLTQLCACVDPAATCSAPAPGSCNFGYCGTQAACTFVPMQPGGPGCGCGQPLS